MKQVYNKDQRLESRRIFKYVAWSLIILFAYFVYTLAMDLRATTTELGMKTKNLEEKSSMNVNDITDFSR